MVRINPISKFQAIVLIAIFTRIAIDFNQPGSTAILEVKNWGFGVSLAQPLLRKIDRANRSMRQGSQTQPAIATLVNGNYQFCTEPPPNDWRTGAGVCFNFTKTGDRASGYYDWIMFGSAKLDTKGFYRYNKLPLTSISQLCKWNWNVPWKMDRGPNGIGWQSPKSQPDLTC